MRSEDTYCPNPKPPIPSHSKPKSNGNGTADQLQGRKHVAKIVIDVYEGNMINVNASFKNYVEIRHYLKIAEEVVVSNALQRISEPSPIVRATQMPKGKFN